MCLQQLATIIEGRHYLFQIKTALELSCNVNQGEKKSEAFGLIFDEAQLWLLKQCHSKAHFFQWKLLDFDSNNALAVLDLNGDLHGLARPGANRDIALFDACKGITY